MMSFHPSTSNRAQREVTVALKSIKDVLKKWCWPRSLNDEFKPPRLGTRTGWLGLRLTTCRRSLAQAGGGFAVADSLDGWG